MKTIYSTTSPPYSKGIQVITPASNMEVYQICRRGSYTELNLFHQEVFWNSSLQNCTSKPIGYCMCRLAPSPLQKKDENRGRLPPQKLGEIPVVLIKPPFL